MEMLSDILKIIGVLFMIFLIPLVKFFFDPKPIKKPIKKWSWYNDGKKNITILEGEKIHDGYMKGKINKEKGSWYNNGEKNIRIFEGETIPDGFVKGQLNQKKGSSYYNNGERHILLYWGQEIPDGFVKGKLLQAKSYWYNNGKINLKRDNRQKIPDGFVKGKLRDQRKEKNSTKQLYDEALNSFNGISIALLSKVAKIDGQITKDEAQYLSEIFDTFSENSSQSNQTRDIYKEILKNEKDDTSNINKLCKKLLSHIEFWKKKDQKMFIEVFLGLAYVDGTYTESEEEIILKIIHNLDISFQIYRTVKEDFEPKGKSASSDTNYLSLAECYKILESKETDTLSMIKQNYRRLIRQYHPDSNASKDLPQGMINFAESQTKILNESFERVKTFKG